MRIVFVVGILIGIPGLAPENSNNHSKQPVIAKVFSESPAQANGQGTPLADPKGLTEWPDLFGGTEKSQPIQPTGPASPLGPRTKASELGLAASSKKKISPPHEDPYPSLHSSLMKVGMEKHSTTSSVSSVSVQPEVPPALKPIVPVTEKASVESLKTDETPTVITESRTATPVASGVQNKTSTAASKEEKTSSKKGFVIKVEGEGKELVVYDADGNEVLRKSRKRESSGTTISGSGKTLTNRKDSSDTKKQETRIAEIQPEPAKSHSEKVKEAKPKLIFDEVKKGENLSLIASRYPGITAEDLMQANQIDDPRCIAAGTKIWIPCDGINGLCHRVEKNETLSSLLKKYEIKDMFKVCDLNGLNYYATNKLEEGQMLIIPDAKAKGLPSHTRTVRAIRSDISKLKGNTRWQWPVADNFKVSSRWGRRIDPFSKKRSKTRAGGPKPRFSMHHGIDLAIPLGTPIHAARDGEVVDISRSRYGHGNMIKIRHDDGWCTVYSHNSKLLKKEGDQVKQGDLIALSGNSGRSTGPHLHFEVRRPNQESVNPKNLLPSI